MFQLLRLFMNVPPRIPEMFHQENLPQPVNAHQLHGGGFSLTRQADGASFHALHQAFLLHLPDNLADGGGGNAQIISNMPVADPLPAPLEFGDRFQIIFTTAGHGADDLLRYKVYLTK